jgi:Replication-relaxation
MMAITPWPRWSARRTARVANRPPHYTGIPDLEPVSAPEGIRSLDAPSPSPERPAANRPERRISRDELDRLHRRLSTRDHAILRSVKQHHFLTTTQLERFHFTSHDSPRTASRLCRRVLARLDELRVLEHLERRIGGVRAGSASYVWRVGLIGDRLLRHDTDQPRSRRKEPSLHHLQHCLAVADTHLALRELAVTTSAELLQVTTEPTCWRSYRDPAGVLEILKPDLYAVTAIGEFEDHWFVEVDRATESIPTLLRQCRQYEAYRHNGTEQAGSGLFPLVLWVVPDEPRAAKLRQAIALARDLDTALFRITTPDQLIAAITGGEA